MKGGVGSRQKAAAMVFAFTVLILIAFIGSQPEKACARANLTAYLTVPHTSWEPMGYNETGSAPWLAVQTVGWNAVKIRGNVGIGDGSMRTLNATSHPDVKYTGAYIMAADVSMAPLDPSRMSGYGQPANKSIITDITSAQDNTIASGTPKENNNGLIVGGVTGNMALNDPYHSILMGRPVDDLLYEDPLIVPITSYARLIGFRMPDGGCVNIGTRCLSYGY